MPVTDFLGLAVASPGVTLVLAHRGANRLAPENTVPAFARAVELGADGVELDIHPTIDDALVVRHDAATPTGLLAEMTLADVRAALPEVPTLGEALDACAGRLVNVEIKYLPTEDGDPPDRMAQLLIDLLAERGGRDRVLVSSFNLASVDRVRSLAPDVRTALLTLGPGSARGAAGRRGARPFRAAPRPPSRSPAPTPAPPPPTRTSAASRSTSGP